MSASAESGDTKDGFTWAGYLEGLTEKILASGIKARRAVIDGDLLPTIKAQGVQPSDAGRVLVALRPTAGLYVDRESRALVKQVVRTLGEQVAPEIARLTVLVVESVLKTAQPASAASPEAITSAAGLRLALLTWACSALATLQTPGDDPAWKSLVLLTARLLWGLAPSYGASGKSKQDAMASAANHEVWRTLRGRPELIAPMLRVLVAETSEVSAVLIGHIVGVAVRLRKDAGGAEACAAVESERAAIVKLIDTALVCAKAPVSRNSVEALGDFVREYVGEAFEADFSASLSRMLLRSPETALTTGLGLLQALDSDKVDLAGIYQRLFANQIANNLLKSSNANVRRAAGALFEFIATKPHTAEDGSKLVTPVAAQLTGGRYTQPEHRAEVYKLLADVRAGPGNGWASAAVLVPELVKMTTKETLEQPVAALFGAIGRQVAILLAHLSSSEDAEGKAECTAALAAFSEAAVRGLALPDRSVVLRLAWATDAVGQPLWDAISLLPSAEWVTSSVYPLLRSLAGIAERAAANPLAASSPVDALVGVALALSAPSAAEVNTERLSTAITGTERSLLLWDKAFHRCTTAHGVAWLLRAAQTLYARGCNDARLAQVILWVTCHFPEPTRAVGASLLSVLRSASAPDALRLWNLLEAPLNKALWASDNRLPASLRWADVLGAVASGDCADKQTLAIRMALAAHAPAVGPGAWIALTQRLGVDPGSLCEERLAELQQIVQQAMETGEGEGVVIGSGAWVSAENLVRDLVFIGHERAARALIADAAASIDAAVLATISADDIAIWRTPATELFHDPLASKAAAKPNRNTRGAKSDDAWAEQVRQEIARKRNEAPKLSREDQQLVDARRAEEAKIRAHVESVRVSLCRGLALIQAIISGNAAASGACMLELVRAVIEQAVVGPASSAAAELAGSELLATVSAMSRCAEGLLASLQMPIAMGLLRARGLERIVPSAWRQETLEDLATRAYFRLRVDCDGSPLPAAGFNFLLPFMRATADVGGWGKAIKRGVEEHDEYAQLDHAAEQLTMVVDLLSFHAHFGADSAMPRKEMVDLLIFLMASQPILLTSSRAALVRLMEAMEDADTPLERDALLSGLLQPDSAVRGACLAALDFADLTEMEYSPALWANAGSAGSPQLEDNAAVARTLWEENGLEVLPEMIDELIPYLNNPAAEIRDAAARSIALAIEAMLADEEADVPHIIDSTLASLQAAYRRWYISLEPEYDAFGIVVPGTQNRTDIAPARVAVASALFHLAPLLVSSEQVQSLVTFLVRERVLGERSEDVRTRMLAAGAQAVATHGGKWATELMPILEAFLSEPDEGTHSHDCIREGVVVLLGRLAQHLPPSDQDRIADAIDRLLSALPTPSESVQRAVSECLPPLAKRVAEDKQTAVVEELIERTLMGEKYAYRRGGAYGLAGFIKGLGLASLKRYTVVDRLRAACENKKEYTQRQGALFAFETMSSTLGRLFEPYVIQFVPVLLNLFGDPNGDVREAALDTARVIMGSISGHGVKLILPAALQGLSDDQWRTKKGSVEMLGAMAFCAPKQLSLALPAVVPRIVTVLADSHHQVAASAREALLRFGDVIHNPEIQALVPVLLAALDDPASKTDTALVHLLHTAFVHYIDAPSLALVVPILQRGMRTRTATTKRNAAQIMGAMATLTEPADLAPYLDELVPLVRTVLIDPVPEARATAAKALGSLVQRLGEERFPSLVADLIRVLKSDTSGVDRVGAAQGLSEVLAGIGISRLESLMPEIIANCQSPKPPVREGFVLLLIYLPTTFGDDFRSFLPQVVPSILAALADDSELVRNAALRAGRILVVSFANGEGIDMLLPALLNAMHDDAWRIRSSAVELLGELLLRVAGVSGKQAERDREAARALFFAKNSGEGDEDAEEEGEEEEGEDAEEGEGGAEEDAAIISNLRNILSQKIGSDRCQMVLAALYVTRSDVSASVRQMAFTVWKSLVANTPRTVRECLPPIMDIVLAGLASDSYDRRATAARTLGDLVHKLGESVMSRVVPILERALGTEQDDEEGEGEGEGEAGSIRHGVFIGLSEILSSAGKAHIDSYGDAMIPLVRRGLCDADPMVREAAASAFNALQQTVGPRAIDLVVPPLLNALQDNSSPYALDALRELMAVRANVVFPVLIPTLTKVPVTEPNARALSALIQVSGSGLSKRLPSILRSIFDSMPHHHSNPEAAAALHDTVRVIVNAAAQDEDTLESLMMEFHECVKVPKSCDLAGSPDVASRVSEACFAVEALCQALGPNSAGRGRSIMGPHVADWLRILIELMGTVGAETVVKSSWGALEALCKTIPKEDYDGYVGPVSRTVQQVTEALPAGQTTLPGFNLPKGLGPLLPIYAQGLLTGSPDTKERAVRGMARMVQFTDPAALRLFATGITGPLIRIVGDRHPANVKAAILSTLGLLLVQIPALMRPFLPQLQRTFVRGLTEADDSVRQRAASALASLIPLQPRLDPLVSELTTGIKQTEDLGMKVAMMQAIRAVVQAPNAKALSAQSFQTIEEAVVGGDVSNEARWRSLRSKTFGSLCAALSADAATKLVTENAIVESTDSADEQSVKLSFLAAVLCESPSVLEPHLSQVVESVDIALAPSGNADQGQAALQAVEVAKNALLQESLLPAGSPYIQTLTSSLIRVADPQTSGAYDTDTQHASLSALKALSKHRFADVVLPVRDAVVLASMAHVRDRVITVKLAAERCLLYALRLAKVSKEGFAGDMDGLNEFVANMGGPASDKGKLALDYHRRVLGKLADATRELDYASDDEEYGN
ncbi:translational activator of GCN4 [Coemansia sp. Benny D115]|nr:translational activator of GCN4 [Coemansia sp. Benny D115]